MSRVLAGITKVIAAALLLAPPVGLVLLYGRLGEVPDVIDPPALPEYAAVTPSEDFDEEQVTVRVVTAPGPVLRAPAWSGVVQQVEVTEGASIESGDPLVVLGGITRIGLHSQLPFSESLQSGDSGREVENLQEALTSLGFSVESDGTFGRETERAVESLQERLGIPKPSGVFSPELVVWMPEARFTVDRILLRVGEPAPAQGTPIVASPDLASSAEIIGLDGRPLGRVGERYELVVDATIRLRSLEGGGLSADQVTTLMAAFREGAIRPVGDQVVPVEGSTGTSARSLEFAGLVRLIDPLVRWTVPVGSVIGSPTDAARHCLFLAEEGGHRQFDTSVVAGGFGWVAVDPAPPETAMVLANPLDVLESASCG